ncbi:MAG TPA: adenylate/guanylate cyclase domain-containing protein [Chitinophagales bacterium]|nr:adenylate/guanylate cyclase domain-containing protein [Chitinophagales bacterium]
MKKLFLFTLYLILCTSSFAQDQHLVDSLETQLKNHNAHKLELKIKSPSLYDTTAANILYRLSVAHWGNNPDKAMDYANQCLAVSEQIGYKKGEGNAFNSMGCINYFKGDYLSALEFHKKTLKIREDIGDKKGIAGTYNNIGQVFRDQGNYPEALKDYFAALKMNEESGNKQWQAINLGNIGIIYDEQGNYPEALKNYLAALKIYEETGDKEGIAGTYNNIGVIYMNHGKYPEALKNYFASLKISKEIGDKNGIATTCDNIGVIYREQGNYPEALRNHFTSLKIEEEIGDKDGITRSYNNIGINYTKEKRYNEAFEYLNKGLSLSKEIGSLEHMKESFDGLAKLDSSQGNFNKALEHYKLFISTRDSLVNNENTKKTVQMQMQYDFDKKESLTKTEQEKKDVVAQKEMQKQKLVRNGFVGGFAVVLLFAGVFFRQRNKISKAKKISEAEKERSEELLLNILPAEVAEEIKTTGTAKAKSFTMVTVMLTDFKDFTSISEKVSAELLVDEIHTCFSAFDNILQKYKIEKIKTIGDAYLCASGLPVSNYTHATDMINVALEIRNYMLERKKEKEGREEIPFELRIGIHTGPVVAGIVGVKKYAYDIWGDTVNLAARMEQNSEAGKVNISGTTYELVKDKFSCTHRGKIQAKNKGEIDMYFVEHQL